jgi:endonuclease YncB( thermonuclease family)
MAAHPVLTLLPVLTLVGTLCPAAGSSAPAPTAVAQEALIEATVTRVIDGNSLDARVYGNRTAVGYLGAETPAPNQPCGQEALERNRELAGTRVLLEEDPAYQFGEMRRRLYYAYTPEGVSIEETLVREGLARAVRTDASRGAYLAAVQAEAEAAGRGCLWGGG